MGGMEDGRKVDVQIYKLASFVFHIRGSVRVRLGFELSGLLYRISSLAR